MTNTRLAGRWRTCSWVGRTPAQPLPPPPAGAGARPSGGWRSASPCCTPQPGTGQWAGRGRVHLIIENTKFWKDCYYGFIFFKESCFFGHSDHRQTSLTCLLLPRPLTATAVSRPRRCSTPSPGLCSDVSEVSTHEHRVRQRMLIRRLCYFPRYHFYSTTNALADIRIDSLVT